MKSVLVLLLLCGRKCGGSCFLVKDSGYFAPAELEGVDGALELTEVWGAFSAFQAGQGSQSEEQ